jgi:hypothetical protein
MIPLDPRSYRGLKWSRVFWGLFYYVLCAAIILALAGGALSLPLRAIYNSPASLTFQGYDEYSSSPIPAIGGIFLLLGIFTWAFQRLLLTPYVSLLRFARSAPTKRMIESDVYVLNETFSELDRRDRTRTSKVKWIDGFLVRRALSSWERYRAHISSNQFDLRRSSPEVAAVAAEQTKQALDNFHPGRLQEIFLAIPQYQKSSHAIDCLLQELSQLTGRPLQQTPEAALNVLIRRIGPEQQLTGYTVEVFDPTGLELRPDRDLQKPPLRVAHKGERLRLGAASEVDGRKWYQLDSPADSSQYVLSASVRSRCTVPDPPMVTGRTP